MRQLARAKGSGRFRTTTPCRRSFIVMAASVTVFGLFSTSVASQGAEPRPASGTPSPRTIIISNLGQFTTSTAIGIGEDAVTTLDQLVPLGLTPYYDSSKRVVRLEAPGWRLEGKLGSNRVTVNGRLSHLPTAIRLGNPPSSPGQNAPSEKRPLIPVVAIAKLRGFRVEFAKSNGSLGPTFTLHGPYSFTPIGDFAAQRLDRSAQPAQAKVAISNSKLDIQRRHPSAGTGYSVFVELDIHNTNKEIYVASDEYLFLFMADGRILNGNAVSASRSARPVRLRVSPGETANLRTGPWIFPPSERTPISRILYMDGRRTHSWTVVTR